MIHIVNRKYLFIVNPPLLWFVSLDDALTKIVPCYSLFYTFNYQNQAYTKGYDKKDGQSSLIQLSFSECLAPYNIILIVYFHYLLYNNL